MREVLPVRPDGHKGEGLGRKKLDPCSNSSRTLWTGETGPAEGINTQTVQAERGNYPSHAVYTSCMQVHGKCLCVYRFMGEGWGVSVDLDFNNL